MWIEYHFLTTGSQSQFEFRCASALLSPPVWPSILYFFYSNLRLRWTLTLALPKHSDYAYAIIKQWSTSGSGFGSRCCITCHSSWFCCRHDHECCTAFMQHFHCQVLIKFFYRLILIFVCSSSTLKANSDLLVVCLCFYSDKRIITVTGKTESKTETVGDSLPAYAQTTAASGLGNVWCQVTFLKHRSQSYCIRVCIYSMQTTYL